jgi:hypothetical protein
MWTPSRLIVGIPVFPEAKRHLIPLSPYPSAIRSPLGNAETEDAPAARALD